MVPVTFLSHVNLLLLLLNTLYHNEIQGLIKQFDGRFVDFKIHDNEFATFSSPFYVNPNDVKENLQIENIELQADLVLKTKFVVLRCLRACVNLRCWPCVIEHFIFLILICNFLFKITRVFLCLLNLVVKTP